MQKITQKEKKEEEEKVKANVRKSSSNVKKNWKHAPALNKTNNIKKIKNAIENVCLVGSINSIATVREQVLNAIKEHSNNRQDNLIILFRDSLGRLVDLS